MYELVKPNEKYAQAIMQYSNAFAQWGEKPYGACALEKYSDIKEWIAFTRLMETEEAEKLGYVPGVTYICINTDNGRMVGVTSIRKYLSENLLLHGGHIGYSVAKDERNKGIGTKILSYALEKCREQGLKRVLITCDESNTASEKVILKNNGVLENVYDGTKRYWIDLKARWAN